MLGYIKLLMNPQLTITGTSKAYFPESHPLSKSKKKVKEIKNYEKWKP